MSPSLGAWRLLHALRKDAKGGGQGGEWHLMHENQDPNKNNWHKTTLSLDDNMR